METHIADDHDRRYKYLFSHPGFVEGLLTSFVDEPFVRELDFSTLKRVNAGYVSEEFARREADVIWKLSFQGRPIYLFDAFIPQLAYYPILVNEIPETTLFRVRNAVSAVFYVENTDPEKLSGTLDELMAILSDEAPEQFAVFGRWISNYLAGTTGAKTVTRAIRSAGEMKSMFATKLQQYGERLKDEARQEGRQEGRQEEKRETARAMKQLGIDVAVIAEVTGLSTEEIEALQIDQFPRT